jgi:hypothetical protein
MTDSNKSISPLRQRMIDDMTMRKLSPKTQAGYLRAVIKFSLFFGRSPDLASPEDLRTFQLQQVEQSQGWLVFIKVRAKAYRVVDDRFQVRSIFKQWAGYVYIV